MKALTIWQPWASLIAMGAKPYEFRGWPPPRRIVGQRLAIHAGARKPRKDEMYELIVRGDEMCIDHDMALDTLMYWLQQPYKLPLSSIVCTAIVGAGKRGDECAAEFGIGTGGNDSDREGTFNWGWPLTEIERVEPPAPARGRQGIWNWEAAA